MKPKKIGIFQYDEYITIHICNLCNFLVRNGYEVTFFQTSLCKKFVSDDDIDSDVNVVIIQPKTRIERAISFLYERFKQKKILRLICLLNPVIYKLGKKEGRRRSLNLIIGVEKLGLIWCGKLNICSDIIYYSLELYLNDHPILSSAYMKLIHKIEKEIHNHCLATIIQDKDRAEVLYKGNGIKNSDVPIILLPISIYQNKNEKLFNYFHIKYSLAPNSKILLYFGAGGFNRMMDFDKIANNLPNDYYLIIHGLNISNKSIKNEKSNIFISKDFFDQNGINIIISSATIGIVLYSNDIENNRLTAYSSEKIARFTQCGIPFISLRNNNYENLQKRYNCLELIEDYNGIRNAIDKIDYNYLEYRKMAFKAFDNIYSYKKAAQELFEFLKKYEAF